MGSKGVILKPVQITVRIKRRYKTHAQGIEKSPAFLEARGPISTIFGFVVILGTFCDEKVDPF